MAFAVGTNAAAAREWQAQPAQLPATLKAPAPIGKKPPNGLPDGGIATHQAGDIRSAWYESPTGRYQHAILGDAVEAGTLAVKTADGTTHRLDLPQSEVFEDLTPRLADLDGDGTVEVVTLRSSLSDGGSVTIYGLSGAGLVEKASTGFIGRTNRWLNVAAIADLASKGRKQIAYVQTPHIGGTLFVYDYWNGKLSQLASLPGFSNHAIGSRELDLAAAGDWLGNGKTSLMIPSDGRTQLHLVAFQNGTLAKKATVTLPHRVAKYLGAHGTGPNSQLFFLLDNGRIYKIAR